MSLAFRVDSSNLIGAGHVHRCLKLAEDLRYKKNKRIFFISRDLQGNFNHLIKKKKFKLILIKKNNLKNDLNFTKKICNRFKVETLIVDNYWINIEWEKKIKKYIKKLVVIDDFTKKKHFADIIINSLSNKNKKTLNLCGLEYVILPIAKNNDKVRFIKKKYIVRIGTFFGSSDNNNITEKVLNIFCGNKFINYKIISILGKNNKNKKKIYTTFNKYKNFHLANYYPNMKKFFKKIDILVTSGGITSFEAIYNNLKCINIPSNFYQKKNSIFQEKKKISKVFNYNKIIKKNGSTIFANCFKKVLNEDQLVENKLYLDEKGSKRISEALIPSKFKDTLITKAKNMQDCIDLFKLFNEKTAIKNSFEQRKVKFIDHINWFKKKIKSNKTYIYIFRINSLCIGQVRIDVKKNELAKIDYSLDKDFRGRGWGKLMLSRTIKIIRKNKNIKILQAEVKKINFKSIKIFENLLFSRVNNKKKITFNKSLGQN